jgi:eukaryotic-like serine/threonine-protein kinase
LAVTSVALTFIEHLLQPEFAAAWAHPVLRITSLCVFLRSVGFIAVQRSGWLSKRQLLDMGMVLQVAVAFCAGLFEGAAYKDPNAVVVGISAIAVWMILCGRLLPNAPLKSALTAGWCAMMWPLGYHVDLKIFGSQPVPLARMLVWLLLCVVGIWMYMLNNRTLAFYVQPQCAEDVGRSSLQTLIGKGGMGEVWRAKHKTLARDASVKLIRPRYCSPATAARQSC